MFIVQINNVQGDTPDVSAAAKSLPFKPVLLFSKLNKIFFRYFNPENIFLDNKNK